MVTRTRYTSEIEAAAKQYGLDPLLVEAVVMQESGGNTDAFRFEPDFYNRYLKPKKIWVGKNPRRVSSSYGLMQVMFPLIFEDNFPENDLEPPEMLFIPEKGLDAGCRRLKMQVDWANTFSQVGERDRLAAALASYNGGKGGNTPGTVIRNGVYARQVLARYDALVKELRHV